MITVYCGGLNIIHLVNIRRTFSWIKHMQTKQQQQLVVKFYLASVGLCSEHWPVLCVMKRKALVFITWTLIKAGLSTSKPQAMQVDKSQGGGYFYPQRSVYLTDKVSWEAMNIIFFFFFLDTSLRQISHLGTDTVNRWHSVLESGHWGRSCCSLV